MTTFKSSCTSFSHKINNRLFFEDTSMYMSYHFSGSKFNDSIRETSETQDFQVMWYRL